MLRTLAAEAARRFGQRVAFAAASPQPQPTGSGVPGHPAAASATAAPAGGAPATAGPATTTPAGAAPAEAAPAGGAPGTPASSAVGPAESWRLSFADLDRLSDEVAAGLAFRGVLPGDVVALALPTAPEFPICYLAAVKIGAIVAGLDPRWPSARLDQLANLLRPAVTVASAGLAVGPGPDGEMVRITLSRDGRAVLTGLRRAEPPPPPLPPDLTRPVVIAVTSAAGQAPRGAVFGVRQLETICAAEAGDRWGSGVGWVVLSAVPCAHYSFMTRLPALLQAGQTSVLMSSWRAGLIPQVAAAVRANRLTGLPAQFAELVAEPFGAETGVDGGSPPPGLPSLELIVSADATLPPGLAGALRKRFGTRVQVRYGCAEAGLGLSTYPDDTADEVDGCVGGPLPGVTVVLRDAGGNEVPHGETGDILLRSGACMNGYWHDAAASAAAFTSDRFVRTGDRGRLDAQGRMVLAGKIGRG